MAKLYYGGYGHHPSGKQYVYWGNDNYRTGQNVNVPVTNKKTGKTYNTMFTIQRTSGSEMGQNEAERLENSGITIKSINGTNVMTLPGAMDFSSKGAWKRYSDEEYASELQARLQRFVPQTNTQQAEERLTSVFLNHKIPVNAQIPNSFNKFNPARYSYRGALEQTTMENPINVSSSETPTNTNADFTKKMF